MWTDEKKTSRRGFILGCISASVLLASCSVSSSRKPQRDNTVTLVPSTADFELAALGEVYRQSAPKGAQQVELSARNAAGLGRSEPIDWQTALWAKSLLTENARVVAEFERGDAVYVDGWLMANSELGSALLLADAKALSGSAGPEHPLQ